MTWLRRWFRICSKRVRRNPQSPCRGDGVAPPRRGRRRRGAGHARGAAGRVPAAFPADEGEEEPRGATCRATADGKRTRGLRFNWTPPAIAQLLPPSAPGASIVWRQTVRQWESRYRGALPRESFNRSWGSKRTETEALASVVHWVWKQHARASPRDDEAAPSYAAVQEALDHAHRAARALQHAEPLPVECHRVAANTAVCGETLAECNPAPSETPAGATCRGRGGRGQRAARKRPAAAIASSRAPAKRGRGQPSAPAIEVDTVEESSSSSSSSVSSVSSSSD